MSGRIENDLPRLDSVERKIAAAPGVPQAYERPTVTPIGQLADLGVAELLMLAAGLLEGADNLVDKLVAIELRVRARAIREGRTP